jgi:flagellar biosynthetic protein FliR
VTAETLLVDLPHFAFGWVLLIARAGAVCMLLPGIGELELPAQIRLGFALALSAIMLPVIAPLVPPASAASWRVAAMVLAEIATGLWLGWLTRLWLLALPIAGQIIAAMTGLANVLQPDPSLGAQTSVLSRALGLCGPTIVLATGLYALPLGALADSYRLVPPGVFLPDGAATETVVSAVGAAFALSLQLAAPFIVFALLWHSAAGLLARLIPQLQIYFAAMPGQILGGFAALALLGGVLLETWQARVADAFAALP